MGDINSVKDFWERNLCLDKFLRAEYLTKEYFDESTKIRYKYHYHIPPVIKELRRAYPQDDAKMLEIGVGMGTDLQLFAENGFNCYGVDLTEKAVKTSKTRMALYGLNADLMVGNAEDLGFPDNTFDVVYSFGVLHHTPNIINAFNEVHRVLKPNGIVQLMLYNTLSLNRFAHMVTGIGFDGSKKDPCPIERSYTKSQITDMLDMFEDLKIKVDYLFGTGWGKFNKMLPTPFHRFLGKYIGWHLMIRGQKREVDRA